MFSGMQLQCIKWNSLFGQLVVAGYNNIGYLLVMYTHQQ